MMRQKRKIAYWFILFVGILFACGMTSVAPIRAHYQNTVYLDAVVPASKPVVSNCLVAGGQTVLLGEIIEETNVVIEFEAESSGYGALECYLVDPEQEELLFVSLSEEEIDFSDGTHYVLLSLIPLEGAEGLEEEVDVDFLVSFSNEDQLLYATFRATLPETAVQDIVETEEGSPEQEETSGSEDPAEGNQETEGEETTTEDENPGTSEEEDVTSGDSVPEEGETTESGETSGSEESSESADSAEGEETTEGDENADSGESVGDESVTTDSSILMQSIQMASSMSANVVIEVQENESETVVSDGEEATVDQGAAEGEENTGDQDNTESEENAGSDATTEGEENTGDQEATEGEANAEDQEAAEGEANTEEQETTEDEDASSDVDLYEELLMESVEAYSKNHYVPVCIYAPEETLYQEICLIDGGTGMEMEMPAFTRYSVDGGDGWYMLYFGGRVNISGLDLMTFESVGNCILLDFSGTVLDETQAICIQAEARTVVDRYVGCVEIYSSDENADLSLGEEYELPVLTTAYPLVLEERGADGERLYTIERLVQWDDGTIEYEYVFEESLTVLFENGTVELYMGEVLPEAGTYRLNIEYHFNDICFATSTHTFFINYTGDI